MLLVRRAIDLINLQVYNLLEYAEEGNVKEMKTTLRLMFCVLLMLAMILEGCNVKPATLESISVGTYAVPGIRDRNGAIVEFGSFAQGAIVRIVPTSSALPDKVYKVDLLEKGKIRGTNTVSWNQPELNVRTNKQVNFPLSKNESSAYANADVSHIFTIDVHE